MGDMEEVILQDFDQDRHTSSGRGGGRAAYDDDDDDGHPHRGGVQCQSQ